MLFQSYAPAPPLSEFVEDFWLYDDYIQPHFKERILPCGTMELVINLRDNEFRIYDATQPEGFKRFSGAMLSGTYAGFFVIDTEEDASVLGVHFRPGGAFPFLGLPAGELCDAHVDLETLWGRSAVDLRERLCVASTPLQRFHHMENALLDHLFRPPEHHYAVSIALGAIERSDVAPTVREIARSIGLSERRFIQVFTAEVGLTPKVFYRVQRFHRILACVQQNIAPDWSRLAVECGYYDQSHLIRDFVAFSGFSPADYLRQQNYLRQKGVHIKRGHLPLSESKVNLFQYETPAQQHNIDKSSQVVIVD
jgi:AraC-like DNA-binding protein